MLFYDGMEDKRQGSPRARVLSAKLKTVRPEAIRAESKEKSRTFYCPYPIISGSHVLMAGTKVNSRMHSVRATR